MGVSAKTYVPVLKWRQGEYQALMRLHAATKAQVMPLNEVTPPECYYWNFQLDNYWMESLDYRYHRIHVNGHSAALNDDGSLTLVVAPRSVARASSTWSAMGANGLAGRATVPFQA